MFSLSDQYKNMIELSEIIDPKTSSKKTEVKINEILLCSFIEDIYSSLIILFNEDELHLRLNENKIKSRFTIL